MSLFIQTDNSAVFDMIYDQIESRRNTDSGFDIPMVRQHTMVGDKTYSFMLGIRVAAIDDNGNCVPCLLLPRSSLAKSSFRLSNSIGLIDQGYRGEVQAKVDVVPWQHHSVPVEHGTRFFQIVQHNFLPWRHIHLVNELPLANDDRGVGGFGSTGN